MNMSTILVIIGLVVIVGIGAFFLMNQNQTNDTEMSSALNSTETNASNDSNMMEETMPDQTIVQIAQSDERFSTLVTALTEAGLVETLSGNGPFTVFAPTNEAFEKLPEGTLEAVLADKDQLTSILTYHVVSGNVMAEDVVALDSATTLQGQDITISAHDGAVMVNDATVTTTDIKASNGVIHVIDTVLLPK